jgi:hypothetical protein
MKLGQDRRASGPGRGNKAAKIAGGRQAFLAKLERPLVGGYSMKRAILYLRVSTIDQTTANQERELHG